jgi:hypothetical protein
VDGTQYAIGASLFFLSSLLVVLTVRGAIRVARSRNWTESMWTSGLGLAAAAMVVESVVFAGIVSPSLLELYVFLSAGIVGVLSLGATRVIRRPRVERGYTAYILAACGLLAILCGGSPMSPSMVTGGIITGNPPLLLIVISSFITVPATVVLLASAAVSLRRSRRWETLLLVAGALILGAGGTLYIASFPVALYYAEFVGIILLFFGLVSLPHPAPAPMPQAGGLAVP